MSLGFIVFAALLMATSGQMALNGLGFFEWLAWIAVLLSMLASLVNQALYSALYSLLFGVVLGCVMILVRSLRLGVILQFAAAAYVAMAGLIIAIYGQSILTALRPHAVNRWKLRVTPFDLHPNLVGFLFAIGAVLSVYGAFSSRGYRRISFVFGGVACAVIVFTSSARASLFAMLVACSIVGAIRFGKFGARFRWGVVIVGVIALISLLVLHEKVGGYFAEVLELGSKTRGINSGGTGRVPLWQKGIATLLGTPQIMFIGGGLRSSAIEQIGFSIENSYLAILLDSGIIVGGGIIAAVIRTAVQAIVRLRAAPRDGWLVSAATAGILVFAVFESFFNRYLIGIGNSSSLLILIVLCDCAKQPLVSRLKVPRVSPRTQVIGVQSRVGRGRRYGPARGAVTTDRANDDH